MTAVLAQSHFDQRAAHECVRRVCGDDSPQVEPSSVLVVDDDPDMRMCFKHLFRMSSLSRYQVEMADSANQAMAMIATRCHDLAILDYKLVDGTAAELVSMWRDFGYEMPFLCVSGYPDVEQEMLAMGASSFIPKAELTCDNLARAIRQTLDRYWTLRARLAR